MCVTLASSSTTQCVIVPQIINVEIHIVSRDDPLEFLWAKESQPFWRDNGVEPSQECRGLLLDLGMHLVQGHPMNIVNPEGGSLLDDNQFMMALTEDM